MNFAIFLIVVLLSMLVLERVWLHVYVKPRSKGLSFSELYIRATYKPLFIVLAVGTYFTIQAPDLLAILLTIVFAVGLIAISYPLARLFYPRYQASQDPSEDPASHRRP